MRSLEEPDRPKSALPLDYRPPQPALLHSLGPREGGIEDVDMRDAGPSTAPLRQGTTFFND